mgnify:CR=1 FL=1
MRVIDLLHNDIKTSKWIVDNYRQNLLYVDNSFQRRYVWLEKHQIQLIETILLGYAIPEIYLWQTDIDVETGDIKYSIVDGQQRIGALFDYIDGRFKLKKNYVTEKNATYVNKYFSQLSEDEKRRIWKYSFTIRQIPSEVSSEEIVRMFLRLNSTDKALNPQELRNAEFNGEFLNTAKEIAGLSFWTDNKVFAIDDIRRMKDIEFVSSLLIFLRKGIDSELSQEAINEVYDLYNQTYEEKEEDKQITKEILGEINRIVNYNPTSLKFISKTTHLYTLFTLTYYIITEKSHFTTEQMDRYCIFIKEYEKDDLDNDVRAYKEYCRDATKSKNSRMKRLRHLRNYLGI